MRTLRQQQSIFAKLIGQLLVWIYEQEGWAVTFADFYRGDHLGHATNSVHYIRLAADLNLFVNAVWMTTDCPEWRIIGAHWKTLDPACRWGGDWKKGDFNHLSMEWGGTA